MRALRMMNALVRSLQSALGLMGVLALFLAMLLPREAVAAKVAFALAPAAGIASAALPAGPMGDAPDGLATIPPTASVPPAPCDRITRAGWTATGPLPQQADWLRPASRASPERS